MLEFVGCTAMRFTKKKSDCVLLMSSTGNVAASCDQVRPPSDDLKRPKPRTASVLKKPSPVPAYTIEPLLGACWMELIARLAMKSFTGAQDAPLSVVRWMPPGPPPIRLSPGGAARGDIARSRRPLFRRRAP